MKFLHLIAIILLQFCRFKLSLPTSSKLYGKPTFTSLSQSRSVYSTAPSAQRHMLRSERPSFDNRNNIHPVIKNNKTDILAKDSKTLLKGQNRSAEFISEHNPSERISSTVTLVKQKEFEIELNIIVELSYNNSTDPSHQNQYKNKDFNQHPKTEPSSQVTSSNTHSYPSKIINSILFQSSTLPKEQNSKEMKPEHRLLTSSVHYTSTEFSSQIIPSSTLEDSNNIINPKLFTSSTLPNKNLSRKLKNVYKSLSIARHNRQSQSTIPRFQSKNVMPVTSYPNKLSTIGHLPSTELSITKLDTTKNPNVVLKEIALNKDIYSEMHVKKSNVNSPTALASIILVDNRPVPWKIRDSRLQPNSFEIACNLDKDEGFGSDSYSSWYFDRKTETCQWFSYKGYGGNGNRFYYRANCEHSCIERYENLCFREDIVNCFENWLQCQMESDLYCQRISEIENLNENIFCPPKQPICVSTSKDIRKSPIYLTHRSLIPSDCYLQKDPGNCEKGSNSPLVYYYDPNINDCLGFLYSNCGGNLNRYPSKFDCMNRCAI